MHCHGVGSLGKGSQEEWAHLGSNDVLIRAQDKLLHCGCLAMPGDIDGVFEKHMVEDCKGCGLGNAAEDVVNARSIFAKPCVRGVPCPVRYVTQIVFVRDCLE